MIEWSVSVSWLPSDSVTVGGKWEGGGSGSGVFRACVAVGGRYPRFYVDFAGCCTELTLHTRRGNSSCGIISSSEEQFQKGGAYKIHILHVRKNILETACRVVRMFNLLLRRKEVFVCTRTRQDVLPPIPNKEIVSTGCVKRTWYLKKQR